MLDLEHSYIGDILEKNLFGIGDYLKQLQALRELRIEEIRKVRCVVEARGTLGDRHLHGLPPAGEIQAGRAGCIPEVVVGRQRESLFAGVTASHAASASESAPSYTTETVQSAEALSETVAVRSSKAPSVQSVCSTVNF